MCVCAWEGRVEGQEEVKARWESTGMHAGKVVVARQQVVGGGGM